MPHESRQCVVWRIWALKVPGPLDTPCAIESLEHNSTLCSFLFDDKNPQGHDRLLSPLKASGEEQRFSAAFGNSLASCSRETSFFINLIEPIKCLPVLSPLLGSPQRACSTIAFRLLYKKNKVHCAGSSLAVNPCQPRVDTN